MAFQTPDGFDVFRRTEPSASLLGTQATTGMDVFRRTEPALSILQLDEAALYTVINGTQAQLANVNAGGTDVDAMTYKASVLLTGSEAAALASTEGVFVTADASPQQMRLIVKNIVRFRSS